MAITHDKLLSAEALVVVRPDVNRRKDVNTTPLDAAACLEKVDILKALLQPRVLTDAVDSAGGTALYYEGRSVEIDIINSLVETGDDGA